MSDSGSAFAAALALIANADAELVGIIGLSLRVSLTAVAVAAVIGLPAGAALAMLGFPGRRPLILLIDSLMGLPPVVAGLAVYLLLSRAGPLGALGLLFTPTAMIVVQSLLVLPIIVALSRQVVAEAWAGYREQLTSLGASPLRAVPTLLWDCRFALVTVLLAGFGRAIAEVGAVMIVGGNIAQVTRTMTTAIALETSRGELALALGLGIILLTLTLIVNAAAHGAAAAARRYGA